MYDETTAGLIRLTPALEGLDRESLPKQLSKAFAEIASARLRLRGDEQIDDRTLTDLIEWSRRLAFTNEALVAVSPERADRASAAFVSATAHQLCLTAQEKLHEAVRASFLRSQSISSDIAAMLLFMVAEATADASEVARRVRWRTNNQIERSLVVALRAFGQGRLTAIVEAETC